MNTIRKEHKIFRIIEYNTASRYKIFAIIKDFMSSDL